MMTVPLSSPVQPFRDEYHLVIVLPGGEKVQVALTEDVIAGVVVFESLRTVGVTVGLQVIYADGQMLIWEWVKETGTHWRTVMDQTKRSPQEIEAMFQDMLVASGTAEQAIEPNEFGCFCDVADPEARAAHERTAAARNHLTHQRMMAELDSEAKARLNAASLLGPQPYGDA